MHIHSIRNLVPRLPQLLKYLRRIILSRSIPDLLLARRTVRGDRILVPVRIVEEPPSPVQPQRVRIGVDLGLQLLDDGHGQRIVCLAVQRKADQENGAILALGDLVQPDRVAASFVAVGDHGLGEGEEGAEGDQGAVGAHDGREFSCDQLCVFLACELDDPSGELD